MQAGDTETHNQAADSEQEDLCQRETPPRVTENKRAQVYETRCVSPRNPGTVLPRWSCGLAKEIRRDFSLHVTE